MGAPSGRTSKYFSIIASAVLLAVLAVMAIDTLRYRQVMHSLTNYMDNLRDLVFMSTYDSLKKGNMKLFKSHLEEIGTFDDVDEFSLLNRDGVVRYSSDASLVKTADARVVGLGQMQEDVHEGLTTYYFPVETLSYCVRCHPEWPLGSINSYYKLTLSRTAVDTMELATIYSRTFLVAGGGVFLGFCYLLLNYYDRRKHEEQLHLSASVFENAVEAIAITTFDGRVQKVNPAFSAITGFSEQDILGQDIHLLDAGEINREVYAQMQAQIRDNGVWVGELWNRKKNGQSFPVRLSVTAVYDRQQRVTHYVSILYDISAEKAAKRALVEMDQMKSEFISSAAHELRTPLSAIMGFTEFVREPEKFGGFSEGEIRSFLDEVYDRSEALNQIIDDLLDISRIENGYTIELNRQAVSMPDILRRLLESYRAHHKSHLLTLDLPESTGKGTCQIDRHRINQVLENLLSNAVKYSPAGSAIVLRGRLLADCWEISVEDRGIGMTPEQIERVFDKFYRADATNTAVSGLGLGMSIAKKIVELHGGRIWVSSTKDEGTTAFVTLPLVG